MGFLNKVVRGATGAVRDVGHGAGRLVGRVVSGNTGGRSFGPIARAMSAQPQAGLSKEVQDSSDVQQRMGKALGRAFKKGGAVSSGRGDGIAVRGKTKCKMY